MNNPVKTMIAASCLVLAMGSLHSQTGKQTQERGMPGTRRTSLPVQRAVPRVIVVSLADRRLALVEDGVVVKVYRVAVGGVSTPSPTGTFTIVKRVENPTYYHDGMVVPPGYY